jgi:nucleoside-diphosphate-sugar epimerase
MLRAFLDAGGTRAVGVGTCAEYDWTRNIYWENDSTLLNPNTSYGRSKLAVFHAFAAAGTLGASTAWGRLFFPYGPGEPRGRLLPSVIGGILRNQPVQTSAGTQVRDFMYLDDVGAALSALVASSVTGPVNIGSGLGRTLSEMIDEVTRQIGGAELIQRGAIPPRVGDPPSIVGRVDRLSQEVGFRPQIDLTEGITRTISYWREQLAL